MPLFLTTSLTLLFSAAAELPQNATLGRNLENYVNCGVCKNVPKSTCQWCDGTGGAAPVSSASSISAPSGNLVDCGVCKNVPQSTCQWCDGYGGVAPVNSGPGGSSPSPASGGIGGSGTCPAGLMNCGVCRCTTPSACASAYCAGSGGITSDATTSFPSFVLLSAFALGFAQAVIQAISFEFCTSFVKQCQKSKLDRHRDLVQFVRAINFNETCSRK